MEFRIKALWPALVAATVGILVAALGVMQLADAAQPLGYTDRLNDRADLAFAPASDGRYVVWVDETPEARDPGLAILDTASGHLDLMQGPGGLEAALALVRGGLVADGRVVANGTWVDLATRSTHATPWPPGFRPEATAAGTVWGHDGIAAAAWTLADGTMRPLAPTCGTFAAATASVGIAACADHSLTAVPLDGGPTRTLAASWRAGNAGTPLVAAAGEVVLAVAPAGAGAPWTVQRVPASGGPAPSGASSWTFAPEPSDAVPVALTATQAGWVLSSIAASEADAFNGLLHAAWDEGGAVHQASTGNAFTDLHGIPSVTRSPRGLVYSDLGDVLEAHPGTSRFPGWPLLLVGLVVAGAGAASVPLRLRHLKRTAAGGRVKCLHCGARRDPALAFCPLCGWRTEDEHKEAVKPVDPWDKDR